ncbi:hypothetical protein LF1_24360 [Rubripirellula obstinata]|uniref:BNR/Asp-box repeat protein n=1 Tax=Rubripirellula obstinata TaxID=406547 RepID=A0A5B1CJK6_9BACT|nr:BNR repeat-containing protein [Rubripirellula obstinata]KAA1259899.1 hypothetical protein LF1_24360 [Rubripirellula obstinata]
MPFLSTLRWTLLALAVMAPFQGLAVEGSDQRPVQTDQIELIDKTTVDQQALTFAFGPAARFSTAVNGRTHQQTPLTTYRGYQYVTYYDAQRRVCIGRRKLPSSDWEIIRFQDHKFKTNDSHNATVLGICDKDGTIHMAFDHHATPLNYRVSKLGVAHDPDSVAWTAELFGGVSHTLGSVTPDDSVTYPRFVPAPNGNLMLYYRAVTSGNGDGIIEEYDGDTHDWTPGLGKFISRDIGTYSVDGETSLYRCPYVDSVSYAGNRLHASWIWRDRFEKTNPKNQHDLCYAYSDDDGRTWHNSNGKQIAETGKKFIHLNSPGLVVAPIPINFGLTNQNTHYAYQDGSIHVLLRHHLPGKPQGTWEKRYHHYWRSSDGTWQKEVLPFAGDRPKLVGTKDRSFVLVYTDNDQLLIAKGSPRVDSTGWDWSNVKLSKRESTIGDALVDLQRWEAEKVLSIYSQTAPARLLETNLNEPLNGFPSSLHVIDYRLTETAQ